MRIWIFIHVLSARRLFQRITVAPPSCPSASRLFGTVYRTVAKMSTGYSSGFRTIFGFSFFFVKKFPIIVATFQFWLMVRDGTDTLGEFNNYSVILRST
ncbi:hypothetical protein ARMSODRAFT_278224 [Armillaria solidipes]|uniref:Uncharacterized protein n=1 Tax=Armillaria solidipes TaxID=1076256 RepID=A0A2H3C2Q5_9AGAR|nr:hypothetical protein ARMSODRAFT_278224 [Armillaria solidipes]